VAFYALRLNRLFGASRVGWSLFMAFALLAGLRIIESTVPSTSPVTSFFQVEGIYALISLLLLIGMMHLEQMFKERLRVERAEQQARSQLAGLVKEKNAELLKTNEELLQ